MSEKNPIRVFVTHTFAESDDYLRVFEFLESVDRFFYLNVAKPENVPSEGGLEAIKDELIQQIKASEALVVAGIKRSGLRRTRVNSTLSTPSAVIVSSPISLRIIQFFSFRYQI